MDNDKSEHIVEDNRTAAIVLAAGKGERFHGETHKLLADFKGKPILQWVIDNVTNAGFDDVYLVSGAINFQNHQKI